ncbi:MAG: hypothetical protein R3E88_16275 [Myxococcota bacterium]|nr:hypothetical protein [Myxococcales bacterium]
MSTADPVREPRASAPSDGRAPADAAATPGELLRCDFCGEPVASVRRVALDRDYDRLRTRHEVRYACDPCSERKERERLGMERR